MQPILDEERRLTEPSVEDDKKITVVGLKDNNKNGSLHVVGPAAFQKMKTDYNNQNNQYKKNNQQMSKEEKEAFPSTRYGKIKTLFPETTHTDDGITVTKAAIKVITGMVEEPVADVLPPNAWFNTYTLYTKAIIDLIKYINKQHEYLILSLKNDKPDQNFTKLLELNQISDQAGLSWLFGYAKWIYEKKPKFLSDYYSKVLTKNNMKIIYIFNWNVTDRKETFEFFKKLFNINNEDYQATTFEAKQFPLNNAAYQYIYKMKYTGAEKKPGRQGSVYGWTPVEFLGLPNITGLYDIGDNLGPAPTNKPLLYRSWAIANKIEQY